MKVYHYKLTAYSYCSIIYENLSLAGDVPLVAWLQYVFQVRVSCWYNVPLRSKLTVSFGFFAVSFSFECEKTCITHVKLNHNKDVQT